MVRTCRKLLALTLVALMVMANCGLNVNQNHAYASEVQEEADGLTSDKADESSSEQNTRESEEESSKEETDKNKETEDGKDSSSNAAQADDTTKTSEDAQTDDVAKTSEDDQTADDDKSEDKQTADADQDKNSEDDKKSDGQTSESSESDSTSGSSDTSSGKKEDSEDGTEEYYDDEWLEEDDDSYDLEDTSDLSLFSDSGPHDIDMPDVISHYFYLQMKSKKVSSASGSNLKVVSDEKEASRYIYSDMPEGSKYIFTPEMTSSTQITVGGGNNGSVSLSTVKNGDYDNYGQLVASVNNGNIQSKVFRLDKCTTNPYAIYTNVGTWYDSSTHKTYSVDMKLIVTGYLYPSESIRKQKHNPSAMPCVGFSKKHIGLTVMGTDYVQTKMIFYYHGSSDEIKDLHGIIQFCDVDAQQGIDFGGEFQKIVMFNASGSHLQYNTTGLLNNSKGYVSSRIDGNLEVGDTTTTVLGLFKGSSVTCRWTVARCDHKDTGGSAAYGVSSGYGIPADSSQTESHSYYYSNSTGFLGIYTDLGMIPIPSEVEKNVYSGETDSTKSTVDQKELSLSDRKGKATFVLSAAAATPSDISKAKYTTFSFQDQFEAAFAVNSANIRVYTEKSVTDKNAGYLDVTSWFTISSTGQANHTTKMIAVAKSEYLNQSDFYGKTYYVHIPVSIRSEEELSGMGLSLSQWYQKDNTLAEKIGSSKSYRGLVAIANDAQLYVISNQGSSDTLNTEVNAVRIPMRVIIRKFADSQNTTVAGVKFALFGGNPPENISDGVDTSAALMTVETDADGYACFEPSSDTFYNSTYGDGPYYICEISIPDLYKNVWNPSIQTAWSYVIKSLSDVRLLETKSDLIAEIESDTEESGDKILQNTPKENPENSVKVYKKSSDTGEMLSGAEFTLYEWSQTQEKYLKLMKLTEGKDEKGTVYYYNGQAFRNSVDNLGKYKVEETKAPEGCTRNADDWDFIFGEDSKEISHTFTDDLQRIQLEVLKEGEDDKKLAAVEFQVKAAEDIYAPWATDSKKERALLVAKGTVVDHITTDEEGIARTSKGHELYAGEYTLEETRGAEGYVCDSSPHKITLTYDEEVREQMKTYSLTIRNDKMDPSMAVAKIADRSLSESGKEVSFDAKAGRYTEEKIPGSYGGGEKVDYTITVTNTGNVDLFELELKDSIDSLNEEQAYSLKDFVKDGSASFEIPDSGYYVSASDQKVSARLGENDPMSLLLDKLSVGDSVEVHFVVNLKENASNAFQLKNDVILTAKYEKIQGVDIEDEEDRLIDVPTVDLLDADGNALTEDWDYINVPGDVEAKVAKLADKTTGASLKDGRYEGKKMEGTYEYGETVDFTITVTNSGTADLYQILVKDTLDKKLLSSLDGDSIAFEEGSYQSILGQEVHAVKKESEESGVYALLLDYLIAGDSVELHLNAKVKSGSLAASSLKNSVCITAEYQTGRETFEKVPHTPEMEDSDTIAIGVPLLSVAKIADKTRGVSLKDGRYSGAKKTGSYQAGDSVLFTITVTNSGTATAKNIVVTEKPSQLMKKYVSVVGYQAKSGDRLASKKGNTITVTEAETSKLTLNQLLPKDSVELIYECKVNTDIVSVKNLINTVKISGENVDGSSIPERMEMKDKDSINLKKTVVKDKTSSSSTYSSSSPKTGDATHTAERLVIITCALLGMAYSVRRRRKQKL